MDPHAGDCMKDWRIEMETSEIRDYVNKEFERVKKIMEDLVEYYAQNSDKEDDISLFQFYNGMMVAYNNVLKTIDDLPGAH